MFKFSKIIISRQARSGNQSLTKLTFPVFLCTCVLHLWSIVAISVIWSTSKSSQTVSSDLAIIDFSICTADLFSRGIARLFHFGSDNDLRQIFRACRKDDLYLLDAFSSNLYNDVRVLREDHWRSLISTL